MYEHRLICFELRGFPTSWNSIVQDFKHNFTFKSGLYLIFNFFLQNVQVETVHLYSCDVTDHLLFCMFETVAYLWSFSIAVQQNLQPLNEYKCRKLTSELPFSRGWVFLSLHVGHACFPTSMTGILGWIFEALQVLFCSLRLWFCVRTDDVTHRKFFFLTESQTFKISWSCKTNPTETGVT